MGTLEFYASIVLACLVLLLICSLYIGWTETYWQRQGLPVLEEDEVIIDESITSELTTMYNAAKKQKFKHVGIYVSFWNRPEYMPVDLDLVKFIIKKDSEYFSQGDECFNASSASHVCDVNLNLCRNLRADLGHVFCADLIDILFENSLECTTDLLTILNDYALINDAADVKEITEHFATDILCNSFLGFKEPGTKIREYVKKYVTANEKRPRKQHSAKAIWNWNRTGNEEEHEWLEKIIKRNVKYRKEKGIRCNDFLQVLIDLNPEKALSVDQISSYSLLLFKMCLKTFSITMTLAIYELSTNLGFQEKLRIEVKEIVDKYDNKITFDGINELVFMEKVVNETLRKYPSINHIHRICTKPHHVYGTLFRIEPGTKITIPIEAINMDPEYYPDPEQFNPDRFCSNHRKRKSPKNFLPLNTGSDICIGTDFVKTQIKIGLATIVRNFKVVLNDKTKIPIELSSNKNNLLSNIWINLSKVDMK